MKIFALAIGNKSRASSRLRLWDHVDSLKSAGNSVDIDYVISSDPGGSKLCKIWSAFIRIPNWLIKIMVADCVIVQEVVLFWPFLPLVKILSKVKVIFDFSDPVETIGTGILNRFQRVGFKVMTRYSDCVCVENKIYIKELGNRGITASHFYGPVDVERYNAVRIAIKRPDSQASAFRIGWTGSPNTFHFIEPLMECLDSLSIRHNIELMLIGVTSISVSTKNLNVILKPWSEESEFNLVPTFDLGLFVLNDDENSKRRGAGKIFVYLAAGVPFAASDIGIARDIMDEAMVGYRVNNKSDWEATIEHAILNPAFRVAIGKAGQSFARDNISYEKYREHLGQMYQL